LLKAGRPEVRRGRGGGIRETVDFLFPMHTTNQVSDYNKSLQATGLVKKGRGAYVFRHGFMRGQGEAGIHPQVTRKATGHAWISTVQGYYDRAGFRPAVDAATMAASAPKGWPASPAPPTLGDAGPAPPPATAQEKAPSSAPTEKRAKSKTRATKPKP
jgi:hypothetical protein